MGLHEEVLDVFRDDDVTILFLQVACHVHKRVQVEDGKAREYQVTVRARPRSVATDKAYSIEVHWMRCCGSQENLMY